MGRPLKVIYWDENKTIKENAILNNVTYGVASSRKNRMKLKCYMPTIRNNIKSIKCSGIDKDWNKISKYFESETEAGKIMGISRKAINNCLRKISKSSGGLYWEYAVI